MTPDYESAALRAAETLIKYGINSTPVVPILILKQLPDVLLVSFESLSNDMDQSRQCVMSMMGEKNQDAFTSVQTTPDGRKLYIVTYNQMLPVFLEQRALARELGHILLGHDGSRPEDVRQEEAKAFAHHLLCPRPLIHAVQASGLRVTMEVLNNLTGCNDYCISCMRKIPATHVPPEMNRKIRDAFMPYFVNFFNYQRVATHKDGSQKADFGTYMDGYEE